MANTDYPSGEGCRRRVAVAGLRQNQRHSDNHPDDRRWPPWLSILFISVPSLALWALIIRAAWWLIEPD